MKSTKILLFILIGLTLTFVIGIGMYSSMAEIHMTEYLIYAVVLLLVLFGIVRVVRNLKDEKKGLTIDDELSKKIKLKAGANSFTASFYLWTMLLLLNTSSSLSTEILLGIGILGMGILFLCFWFYHKNKGFANED